jgi:hypothetical protein
MVWFNRLVAGVFVASMAIGYFLTTLARRSEALATAAAPAA